MSLFLVFPVFNWGDFVKKCQKWGIRKNIKKMGVVGKEKGEKSKEKTDS